MRRQAFWRKTVGNMGAVLSSAKGQFSGSDLLLVVIGIIPRTGVALILLARYRDQDAVRTASVVA